MTIRLEKRETPLVGGWTVIVFSVAAVLVGMAVGGLLFLPFDASPLDGYAALIGKAFFNLRGFGFTLVAATPLMLVSFGTIVAWRCGFIFLGFEGCLLIGAMGGTMIGLQALDGGTLAGLPPVLVTSLALAWGGVLGAFWAAIVGELKVRYGGNEVLIALMMNFLAIYLVQYLVVGPWRVVGDMPQTDRLPRDLWLPYIVDGTRLHAGILVALVAGIFVHILMTKTRAGYEMISSGLNSKSARYGGIDVAQRQRQAAFIAGGMAGLAGAITIFGVHHRLLDGLSDGTGFLGIVTALLGRLTAPGAVVASVLYGGLSVGGDAMQRQSGLPSSIVVIVQATIVLLLLASEVLRTHRLVFANPAATEA
ncbi:ABC transporter permease [Oricola indica]|uniref:ABC transporter permease n=1 Tax=Oricola indica TaxID=2872591 RepID=UPI003CCB99F1